MMPEISFTINDAVWQFLNKKGEPAEVAKRIVESAWEMDGRDRIKGILTNCRTGKESEVELEYTIKPSTGDSSRKTFVLQNGVTGYESFSIDEWVIESMARSGWLACVGTEGTYDKLFIPAIEMRKVFLVEGLIK